MADTQGEERFEEYLTSHDLKADYEVPQGGKHPDYLVHFAGGDVVCEVKDIEPSAEDERIRTARAAVGIDPYPRIREKINVARLQLQPYKGNRPCVLVLHNAGALVHLENNIVAGAMFGDLGFVVNVGDADSVRSAFVGRAKAKMRAKQNTTFSAVAVVEFFLPNAGLFSDLLADRVKDADAFSAESTERILKAMDEIRYERHDIDFEQRVARVRLMHNPYAAVPLPPNAFVGPHDEHWTPRL